MSDFPGYDTTPMHPPCPYCGCSKWDYTYRPQRTPTRGDPICGRCGKKFTLIDKGDHRLAVQKESATT